jgi:hypothetical protein
MVLLLNTCLQFFTSSAPKTELQSEIESVHLKVDLLLLSLLNAKEFNIFGSINRGQWFSKGQHS